MINGFVVIDKPAGITSHDVVSRVRRIIGTRKVGHTGTLDPFATGVLPVAVNEGTKAIPFLDEGLKCYQAVMQLGITTDTLDMTGAVVQEAAWQTVNLEHVEQVIHKFTGQISQIPPMYSALKRDGQPLYKLARKGQIVERTPRNIEIFTLELLTFEPPFIGFKVVCSRGTYVRTLADDMGTMLGCGAALKELRRLASGPFDISAAVSLEALEESVRAGTLETVLMSPFHALAPLPEIPLTDSGVALVRHGRSPGTHDLCVVPDVCDEAYLVRLTYNGDMVAVAQCVCCDDDISRIMLKRVFI